MVPKNASVGIPVISPISVLPIRNVRIRPSVKFNSSTLSNESNVLVPEAAVVAEAVLSIIIVHGASLIMQLIVPQTMLPARLKNSATILMSPRPSIDITVTVNIDVATTTGIMWPLDKLLTTPPGKKPSIIRLNGVAREARKLVADPLPISAMLELTRSGTVIDKASMTVTRPASNS